MLFLVRQSAGLLANYRYRTVTNGTIDTKLKIFEALHYLLQKIRNCLKLLI